MINFIIKAYAQKQMLKHDRKKYKAGFATPAHHYHKRRSDEWLRVSIRASFPHITR